MKTPSLSVLVVEDDDSLRLGLETFLEASGIAVKAVRSAEEALAAYQKNTYSLILTDFRLPGLTGLELLERIRSLDVTTPIILMTAYGSIAIAVEAMRFGANDFITKPFQPESIVSIIQDVVKHKRIIHRESGGSTREGKRILTKDKNMLRLLEQVKRVAAVDTPVMFLGESGTGKELLARFAHDHSARKEQPFVAINCGAIPSELLESELFGHEAGAYTGASQQRVGLFEYAKDGTIFLDEIGDMPLPLQVKLLRVLQEGEIRRVGGVESIEVRPRIISATNCDIELMLDEKRFREDLFYRIAVFTFAIPSLAERPVDIELLTDFFLNTISDRHGRRAPEIAPQAKQLLLTYSWPGNARELENVIERALVLAEESITPDQLGIDLSPKHVEEACYSLHQISQIASREAEERAIKNVLIQTDGNKSKAAEILGVSYKTLLNKVKEYQIS